MILTKYKNVRRKTLIFDIVAKKCLFIKKNYIIH
jgi:hypothetical protein